MAFPPVLLYPNELDTDYTLFLVYNTTESRLCEDNHPWSNSISIVPSDELEIWADNGFGNIDGELFYYDSVTKNENGKVVSLDNCARQLQGTTKYNRKGTWVRSYVIAEHHNQIVDAVLNLENFIGRNFDPRQFTLDWRIRNLQSINPIADDFSCPDIDFDFRILETDNVTGILATYSISSPDSVITSFRLDFGDGEFTTTNLTGEHRYALNARIDPVVTVSNTRCQIIQTPNVRENPLAPNLNEPPTFTITIPPPPTVPDFNIIPVVPTPIDIVQPPLVTPCGVSSSLTPVPSEISIVIPGGSIPSVITIENPIPSTIFFDIPSITVTSDIPSNISVVYPPSTSLALELTGMPLMVDWGTAPTINIMPDENLTVQSLQTRSVGKPEDLSLILPLGSKLNTKNIDLNVVSKSANSVVDLTENNISDVQSMSVLSPINQDYTPVNQIKTQVKNSDKELIYNGEEKKVKLTLDKLNDMVKSGQYPCVMLVPVTNV